jgi:hypothetical protein
MWYKVEIIYMEKWKKIKIKLYCSGFFFKNKIIIKKCW